MESMVEDALKSTRTLHRLIVTVSLGTLAFSLSLSDPADKVAQRDAVRTLMRADFVAYDEFVDKQLDQGRSARILANQATLDSVTRRIDSQRDQIENSLRGVPLLPVRSLILATFTALKTFLSVVPDEISEPVHIGRLRIKNIPALANPEGTTLNQLSSVAAYCFSCNVQLLYLDATAFTREFIERIQDYPSEHAIADGWIPKVTVQYSADVDSFLRDPPDAIVTFDPVVAAREADSQSPTNTQHRLPVTIEELQNSSFISWYSTSGIDDAFLFGDDGRLVLTDVISRLPARYRDDDLEHLVPRLSGEIEAARPESRQLTILGILFPGAIIGVAVPVILLLLGCYFAAHTSHLVRLASEEADSFVRFAWMPLVLRWDTLFCPFGKSRPGCWIAAWAVEITLSAIVVPTASIACLHRGLSYFGLIDVGASVAIVIVTGMGMILCGVMSVKNIRTVRNATLLGSTS